MDETSLSRFHVLRHAALHGALLSEDDTAELAGYMTLIENEELESLRPVQEVQKAQIVETERLTVELRQLVARREVLADRLRRLQAEVIAERESIDAAFRQLMGTYEQQESSTVSVF